MDKLSHANDEYKKGNFDAAVSIYKALATDGNFGCARRLGWMYYSGQGVDKNIDEAMRWLKIGVDVEDVDSMYIYGKAFLEKGEFDEAFSLLERLAQDEYPPAIFKLGQIHLDRKAENEKGVEMLKWADKLGNLPARRGLGMLYLKKSINPIKKLQGLLLLFSAFIGAIKVALKDEHDVRLIS